MNRTFRWLGLPLLAVALILATTDVSSGVESSKKTEVNYVGDRFSLQATLDGAWIYDASEAGDLFGLRWKSAQGVRPGRMRTLVVAERSAADDWPDDHTEAWAAREYWKAGAKTALEASTGTQQEFDAAVHGELLLSGRTFHTNRYALRFEEPHMEGYVLHYLDYVSFPEDYRVTRRFYQFVFTDLLHKDTAVELSPDLLHTAIAGFTVGPPDGPGESTVRWISGGGEHVVLHNLKQQQTRYFHNNSDGLSFGFAVDGIWNPTEEPGLLQSVDGKNQVGALIWSEEFLQKYKGKDLVTRAATCQREFMNKVRGTKAKKVKTSDFGSRYPDSIRWRGEWPFKMYGQTFTAEVVRYIAEIRPGWVAVVTASTGAGGDDRARNIFDTMEFFEEPDGFGS